MGIHPTSPAALDGAQPGALPTPTGRHSVGRMLHEFVDPQRDERYAGETDVNRRLVVWIWYPAMPPLTPDTSEAQAASNAPPVETVAYLPSAWAATASALGFAAEHVRAHAIADASVASARADQAGFPVLLFSPAGFAPALWTALLGEIASHGYVVCAVNHTYETLPATYFADGSVAPFNPAAVGGAFEVSQRPYEEDVQARGAIVAYKAADLGSALDELTRLNAATSSPLAGRLDLARVGVFGHSMGGNAAAELCQLDPRCRAGVNLDGGLWRAVGAPGAGVPFLQLFTEHEAFVQPCAEAVRAGVYASAAYWEADRAYMVDGWQRLYETARPGYSLLVRGARHGGFMDIGFLPLPATSLLGAGLAGTTITPERLWRVASDVVLRFFDAQLGDGEHLAAALSLEGPSPAYPELVAAAPRVLFAHA